tara:strand:+ start:15297 stop:15899 length:603 start_codon:yes stop_codon:yes gene_type:complete
LINLIKSGVGNIGSVARVLEDLETDYKIVENNLDLNQSNKIILPGIGSFDSFIKSLKEKKLFNIIKSLVIDKKIPILGICVGMQSFFNKSEEGEENGFGFFNSDCKKFESIKSKVPHLGWNNIKIEKESKLFNNLNNNLFYFAHSYYADTKDISIKIGSTNYGIEFISVVNKDNIFGVQFHPEKSYDQGIKIIENFINEC